MEEGQYLRLKTYQEVEIQQENPSANKFEIFPQLSDFRN